MSFFSLDFDWAILTHHLNAYILALAVAVQHAERRTSALFSSFTASFFLTCIESILHVGLVTISNISLYNFLFLLFTNFLPDLRSEFVDLHDAACSLTIQKQNCWICIEMK